MTYTNGKVWPRQYFQPGLGVSIYFDLGPRLFSTQWPPYGAHILLGLLRHLKSQRILKMHFLFKSSGNFSRRGNFCPVHWWCCYHLPEPSQKNWSPASVDLTSVHLFTLFTLVVAVSIRMYVCPLPMQFFRPVTGPQITLSVQGLSLTPPPLRGSSPRSFHDCPCVGLVVNTRIGANQVRAAFCYSLTWRIFWGIWIRRKNCKPQFYL